MLGSLRVPISKGQTNEILCSLSTDVFIVAAKPFLQPAWVQPIKLVLIGSTKAYFKCANVVSTLYTAPWVSGLLCFFLQQDWHYRLSSPNLKLRGILPTATFLLHWLTSKLSSNSDFTCIHLSPISSPNLMHVGSMALSQLNSGTLTSPPFYHPPHKLQSPVISISSLCISHINGSNSVLDSQPEDLSKNQGTGEDRPKVKAIVQDGFIPS